MAAFTNALQTFVILWLLYPISVPVIHVREYHNLLVKLLLGSNIQCRKMSASNVDELIIVRMLSVSLHSTLISTANSPHHTGM